LEILFEIILPAAPWTWIDSVSGRNGSWDYFLRGKGDRYLGLITLPPSCTDYLEIREPQPPGTLRVVQGLLYLLYAL
jgi:hypothetical protein